MLTDLTFIQTGAPWPPTAEKARLATYEANRKLFEAEHAGLKSGVFKEAFSRIMRETNAAGEPMPPTSYEMVINYPKLITVATAGLLFNKAPNVIAGEEADEQAMLAVQDISERSDLQATLYAIAMDVSRYGDGLMYVHRGEDNKGIVDITRPDVWFPVVDGANIRKALYHVLATPYTKTEPGMLGIESTKHYLRVEIHSKGSFEVRDYTLRVNNLDSAPGQQVTGAAQIGAMVGTPRVEQTRLTDFAVIPVHNLRPSDRVHGMDDYTDIQSLVCELEVRMAQISKVLDRHSDPTMQGPEEALTTVKDKDGNEVRIFLPGQFYVNQAGGQQGEIKYTTWEAHLDANFKLIDKIQEMIRVTSEMGALLSDMSDKSGAIPSGAAMRRMLYSAISKISRIRNSFTVAIKKALVQASLLGGVSLADKPLYIKWPDTLPRDPKELAEIAQTRTGSKQTQSTKRAIMELDELSEDEAEEELESILDEQAASMTLLEQPKTNEEPPDDDTDENGEGSEGV